MPAFAIVPLETTSPTTATEMTLCGLRAGLSSCRETDAWVLHDPRLWLGIAFHSLMQKARKGLAGAGVSEAWNEAIDGLARRAASHQFDRRFASIDRWPDYYLAEERALSAAADLAGKSVKRAAELPVGGVGPASGTEKRLTARSGRLVGRPDRFDRHAVTDYKSNLPDQTSATGSEILRSYRRQIKIYAAMVSESAGYWPEKGIIAGASGDKIEFDLIPADCDSEADRAVDDLDQWNHKLISAVSPSDIATPSEPACQNCRFQLVCPAFWPWLAQRKAAAFPPHSIALAGKLKFVQLGNDGDVQTVALTVATSTNPQISTASLVTRRSIHGDLSQVSVGTECRIAGAAVRRDGRLVAGLQTLLMPTHQIPPIVLHPATMRAPTEVRLA